MKKKIKSILTFKRPLLSMLFYFGTIGVVGISIITPLILKNKKNNSKNPIEITTPPELKTPINKEKPTISPVESPKEEPKSEKSIEELKKEVWTLVRKYINDDFSFEQNPQNIFISFLSYGYIEQDFLEQWKNKNIDNNDRFLEAYKKDNDFYRFIKQDWLIYKLEQLKEFWTTSEHLFSQIEARLDLFLKAIKGENISFIDRYSKRTIKVQWGVDNHDNWGLNPEKFYSNNLYELELDGKFLLNVIKEYEKWKWVKVEPDSNPDRYKNIKFEKLVTSRNPIINEILKQDENFILIGDYKPYSFISKTDEEIEKILNDDETYDNWKNQSDLEKKYWNFTSNIKFWNNSFIEKNDK
ncbi:hypothetical protein [Mycoplasmopsis pullorum]|uniref:Uncharacterized protein n=1 Tax=Mycoplasmopsis pullorum TaxID=48003 RepID=A0A1L4FSY3_9BACT|nr:hypothetical protein [Mycoplasmopsis pullorum]APJ38704.1 hypothetical protein BLA55_03525 [Mycoplasmopsis pullorum]